MAIAHKWPNSPLAMMRKTDGYSMGDSAVPISGGRLAISTWSGYCDYVCRAIGVKEFFFKMVEPSKSGSLVCAIAGYCRKYIQSNLASFISSVARNSVKGDR